MKHLFVFALVAFCMLSCFSQVPEKTRYNNISNDCNTAVKISVEKYVALNYFYALKGFGKTKELNAIENVSFSESNSAWYLLNIFRSGDLVLNFYPNDSVGNIDFVLFNYPDSTFCDQLNTKPPIPVRNNLSKFNLKTKGETGLSTDARQTVTNKNSSEPFTKSLKVTSGEKYMLVLNNPSQNNLGYTGYVSYAKKITIQGTVTAPGKVLVLLLDSKGVAIEQTQPDNAGNYTLNASLAEEQDYLIAFRNELCFPETEIINTNILDESNPTFSINKTMKKLKLGETYNLLDGIDPMFLKKCQELQIMELFNIMKQKPSLKIEIQGHSNYNDNEYPTPVADGTKNANTDLNFSNNRAHSVYLQLQKMGINTKRMKKVGYSSTKRIFQNPKNEEEKNKNKRVSIKIIAL